MRRFAGTSDHDIFRDDAVAALGRLAACYGAAARGLHAARLHRRGNAAVAAVPPHRNGALPPRRRATRPGADLVSIRPGVARLPHPWFAAPVSADALPGVAAA